MVASIIVVQISMNNYCDMFCAKYLFLSDSEAYLRFCYASMMEFFCENNSIVDLWQCPKYASVIGFQTVLK